MQPPKTGHTHKYIYIMYTLRTVSEHHIYNQSLGGAYSVVSKMEHPKDFEHYSESVFGKDYDPKVAKEVVKFIITSTVIPIYKTDNCYVMTESGKTFECINNSKK